jgi:LPS O-antigen subunit length determinant protein (WzzB/FepE family)
MKYNNRQIKDDEIDLLILLKLLWKKKSFILCFSLISFALGFFYFLGSTKFFKESKVESTIFLREVPPYLFDKYKEFSKRNLASSFNNEFIINFEDPSNLSEFYSQFKKNNFSEKEDKVFYIKKKKVNEKNGVFINSEYNLIHKANYDPSKFINDYMFFIKNITEQHFKKSLKIEIENQISVLTNNLQIAEKIFLKNPISKEPGFIIYTQQNEIFYKGSEILSLEIQYYKNSFKEIDQLKLDYKNFSIAPKLNPSNQNISTNTAVYYGFFGMVLGLFLSILIIYLKIIIRNN